MSLAEDAGLGTPVWWGRTCGLAKHRPDIQSSLWGNGNDILGKLSATLKLRSHRISIDGLPVIRPKHFMALEHPQPERREPQCSGVGELCAADIKALDQAVFDSKHVTDHLIC